jgi:enamine deaminase RidA (YjgF/YER057c/UK114 family)
MEGFMPVEHNAARAKPGSRLRELGVVLPNPPAPLGAYVEASQVGSLLFLSGTLPLINRKLAISGRLGADLSVDQVREAARLAALNALAAAQEHVGDLDRLKKLVNFQAYDQTANAALYECSASRDYRYNKEYKKHDLPIPRGGQRYIARQLQISNYLLQERCLVRYS